MATTTALIVDDILPSGTAEVWVKLVMSVAGVVQQTLTSDTATNKKGVFRMTGVLTPSGATYALYRCPNRDDSQPLWTVENAAYSLPLASNPPPSGSNIYVDSANGSDNADGKTWATAKKTLASALTAIGTTSIGAIKLAGGATANPKSYDVGNGLSLSGYSCTIQGDGPGVCQLFASTQTGPVLDFQGWNNPGNQLLGQMCGGFSLKGSGTATSTYHGLRVGTTLVNRVHFYDIAVSNTGGTPLFLDGGCEWNDFDSITLFQPVNANANSIPYWYLRGACNGNRFKSVIIWNIAQATESVNGCLVLTDDGTNNPTANTFWGCGNEGQRIPTNGSIISCKGTQNVFHDWQFFDQQKSNVTNTGTAWVRFPATFNGVAGNTWDGTILANQANVDLDFGVDISQSGTVVRGLRGYSTTAGSHIRLNSGAGRCFIELQGELLDNAQSSVTDNSGVATNFIYDRSSITAGSQTLAVGSQIGTSGTAPTPVAGGAAGTSPPTPTAGANSNNSKGLINFGTGTSPTAGDMVDVYYGSPTMISPAPHVVISPQNAATAALQPYVFAEATDHFGIGFGVAPAASQSVGTYKVSYKLEP